MNRSHTASPNAAAEEAVLVRTYSLLDAIDSALDAHDADCPAGCVCEDFRMAGQLVDRLLKETLESNLLPFPAMERRWAAEQRAASLAVVS
jgi:hypothetical protein